jgi:hypothetical protein
LKISDFEWEVWFCSELLNSGINCKFFVDVEISGLLEFFVGVEILGSRTTFRAMNNI